MNKKNQFFINAFLLLFLTFFFVGSGITAEETWDPSVIQSPEKYVVKRFWKDGKVIVKIIVPGRPPKTFRAIAATAPQPNIAMGTNTLSDVPAFDWSYGCSATSAAMMMGYYDNYTYPDMYTGPTNGGVCPMNNSVWNPGVDPRPGTSECPLSATHLGYDERIIKGHVDDYWIEYGSTEPDPFIDNWTEHTQGDCTGDYMGTNQSSFGNTDGSTTFYFWGDGSPCPGIPDEEIPGSRDGCYGLKLFAESRGYTVETNFSQYIYGWGGNTLGFTFDNFQAEINAGRPVLIQVSGHTMLGYGYNAEESKIYIHDTWDHLNHSMTWGGTYEGHEELQHYGVTVLRLVATTPIADFSGTPTTGIKPLAVQFTDLSKGNIDTWSWNFGDSVTSVDQNPFHTYATSDDFTVSLTVSGPGGSDIETKTNYIHVTEPAEISGTVTLSGGNGLVEEVTLILSGDDFQTTHPVSGNYSFTVALGGNYTVTPSLSDYAFIPDSRSYNPLSGNISGQNYTGYANTNLRNVSNFFTVPGIEQITLAWTNPSAESFSGVLIVGEQTDTEPTWTAPVNGEIYNDGDLLGAATVIYKGTGNVCIHTGLPDNTTYYYKAYSFSPGPIYLSGVVTSGRSAEFVSDELIDAGVGGTVSGEGGDIFVDIPAGAFSGNATVTISRVENPPASLFNYGLQCGFDIDLGEATLNPGEKIAITIPYTQDDLNQAGVNDAHNLKVYYYNNTSPYPADWDWEEVAVLAVDTGSQQITFEVEHCSIFGFGSPASIIPLPSSSGGGGGGCFIATAAFGTPMATEVIALKKFRDNVLLKTIAGRNFVKIYYCLSPPIADFIRNKPLLKAMVRMGLKPLVWWSRQITTK